MVHSLIGVDEVGRGAWAGPLLVVAARQLSDLPSGIKDSKLLSKAQREKILDKLSISCEFGEGWVDASEIDFHGLSGAMRLGVQRSINALKVLPIEQIIMDGNVNYVDLPNSVAIINADDSHPVVSAASVYAKVLRDRFMVNLENKHPGYGFDKHVGYGTSLHKQMLANHGVIKDIHRLSFKPVMEFA